MTEEKKKACDFGMHYFKPCSRPLYDDKRCIFHSTDIEGKKDEFDARFGKEFERQKKEEKEYDFRGFVFPVDKSFGGMKFEKDANFEDARFSGVVDFRKAQFSGEAIFREAQFSVNANFGEAKFSESYVWVDFGNAQFSGEAIFREAQFSVNANFGEAKFKKEADFKEIKLEKCDKCEMSETYFYNVSGLFEFIEENKKKFKYSHKTEFLPDNFTLILGEEATARYPIISRKIRDDMYLLRVKEKHPKLHFIWWLFADCGRSFFRWALWSLGFAVVFALLYWIVTPCFEFTNPKFAGQSVTDFWSYLYFSFVTFTTLGFGDIVGVHWVSKFFVTVEVILGYVMLGGLISILANKLARRS